jgi:hypothetical protein
MGDIADDHLNQMLEDGTWGWACSRRSRGGYSSNSQECGRCGATGLNWRQIKGGGWRLHKGKGLHECGSKPNIEGFEDITNA